MATKIHKQNKFEFDFSNFYTAPDIPAPDLTQENAKLARKANFKALIGAPLTFDQYNLLTDKTKARLQKNAGKATAAPSDINTLSISWHKYGNLQGNARELNANTTFSADMPAPNTTFLPALAERKRAEKLSREQLQKKAFKKWHSKEVAQALIDWNPQSKLIDKYKRALDCSETIHQNGKTLISLYCKQRFCPTCNNIRTAKLIETWEPILKKWSDLRMVTLTIKNVKGQHLEKSLEEMSKTLARIMDTIRKRYPQIKALAKFEITHNQDSGEYHPHIHALACDQIAANLLRSMWIKAWNPPPLKVDKYGQITETKRQPVDRKKYIRRAWYGKDQVFPCSEKAQQVKRADLKSVKELFKYVTKLSVKVPGSEKSEKNAKSYYINPVALDTILSAIPERFRTFRHYGVVLSKEVDPEEIDELQSVISESVKPGVRVWKYDQQTGDWLNRCENLQLTNFDKAQVKLEFIFLEPYEPPS